MIKQKLPVIIAALTCLCGVSTSFAETATDSKVDKKVVDARIDDQTIVCKREDSTGTRLGATKVCHTRAQWAAMSAEARQQVDRIQTSPQTH